MSREIDSGALSGSEQGHEAAGAEAWPATADPSGEAVVARSAAAESGREAAAAVALTAEARAKTARDHGLNDGRRSIDVGSSIHVRKLRPDGSQAYAWDGTVLQCDELGIVLRAQFNVDLVDLGFTTFRRGDEFVEFYYWERWYNVFQVSLPDGTLKGWYANVGLPAELDADAGELVYVDLALDVWTDPSGDFEVLDEDELEVLLSEHAELTEAAERGRTTLIALAESRQMPRWPA